MIFKLQGFFYGLKIFNLRHYISCLFFFYLKGTVVQGKFRAFQQRAHQDWVKGVIPQTHPHPSRPGFTTRLWELFLCSWKFSGQLKVSNLFCDLNRCTIISFTLGSWFMWILLVHFSFVYKFRNNDEYFNGAFQF